MRTPSEQLLAEEVAVGRWRKLFVRLCKVRGLQRKFAELGAFLYRRYSAPFLYRLRLCWLPISGKLPKPDQRQQFVPYV